MLFRYKLSRAVDRATRIPSTPYVTPVRHSSFASLDDSRSTYTFLASTFLMVFVRQMFSSRPKVLLAYAFLMVLLEGR